MTGDSVALDTSVAIAVLAGQAGTLLSQPAKEFLLPVPVVGELRYGALNSRRSAENLGEVGRLVARCRVLEVTAATAAVYARLRLGLKEKGKPTARFFRENQFPQEGVYGKGKASLCLSARYALGYRNSQHDVGCRLLSPHASKS